MASPTSPPSTPPARPTKATAPDPAFEDFVDDKLARFLKLAIGLAALGFLALVVGLGLGGLHWAWYLVLGLTGFFCTTTGVLAFLRAQLDRYNHMAYAGLVVRNFWLETEDGLTLRGYAYCRAGDDDAEPRPTIVSIHGWAANHRRHEVWGLPLVRTRGYRLFTLDLRGHARQAGDKNDPRLFADVRRYLDHVTSLPEVDVARVGVIGTSMGAAIALRVAYAHPRVRAIAALAAPADFKLTLAEMPFKTRVLFKLGGFRLAIAGDTYRELSAYPNFQPEGVALADGTVVPNADRVLLLHCADDQIVSYSNMARAAEKLGLPPANTISFPTGGHGLVANESHIILHIADFFDQHLLGRAPPERA